MKRRNDSTKAAAGLPARHGIEAGQPCVRRSPPKRNRRQKIKQFAKRLALRQRRPCRREFGVPLARSTLRRARVRRSEKHFTLQQSSMHCGRFAGSAPGSSTYRHIADFRNGRQNGANREDSKSPRNARKARLTFAHHRDRLVKGCGLFRCRGGSREIFLRPEESLGQLFKRKLGKRTGTEFQT